MFLEAMISFDWSFRALEWVEKKRSSTVNDSYDEALPILRHTHAISLPNFAHDVEVKRIKINCPCNHVDIVCSS